MVRYGCSVLSYHDVASGGKTTIFFIIRHVPACSQTADSTLVIVAIDFLQVVALHGDGGDFCSGLDLADLRGRHQQKVGMHDVVNFVTNICFNIREGHDGVEFWAATGQLVLSLAPLAGSYRSCPFLVWKRIFYQTDKNPAETQTVVLGAWCLCDESATKKTYCTPSLQRRQEGRDLSLRRIKLRRSDLMVASLPISQGEDFFGGSVQRRDCSGHKQDAGCRCAGRFVHRKWLCSGHGEI